MAATGRVALGIDLGINFDKLGADLGKVADRIESVGKAHSLKIGATVADIAGGKADPEKVGESVAQIGVQLTTGIAEGVRASAALLVGLGTHMNAVLDRLAGASITLFRRIDASMKFPIFDSFLKSTQLRLTNFTRLVGRRPLTALDQAAAGAYGRVAQVAARSAQVLVDSLKQGFAVALGGMVAKLSAFLRLAMREAAAEVVAALKEVSAGIAEVVTRLGQARGAAEGSVPIFAEMAAAAQAAAAPPVTLAGPIPPRSQVPGVGRRIGFGTNFAGAPPAAAPQPPPVVPARPRSDLFGDYKRVGVEAARSVAGAMGRISPALKGVGTVGYYTFRTLAQVAAAFVSVPLRGVVGIYRLKNFLSSLGDVGNKSFHDLYESYGLFGTVARQVTRSLLRVGTLGVFGRHKKDADGASGSVKRFRGEVDGSRLSLRRLGAAALSVGRQVLMAFELGFVVFKVVNFFRQGVKEASDLNETVNRTRTVFGDAFGEVEAQADRLSKAYGIVRKDQLDVAAGFGAMAQGAGMSEKASAGFANRMNDLVANFTSSVNPEGGFTAAAAKIRSALAGESEALREYGVWLDESTVKAAAGSRAVGTLAAGHVRLAKATSSVRSLGTAGVPRQANVSRARAERAPAGGAHRRAAGELDNLTKLTVRADLITRGLAYAQGDLARTAGDAANQFRKAGGGMTEFGTRIGAILLPAVKAGTEGFNELLATVLEFVEASSARLTEWGTWLKGVLDGTGVLVRNFGALWTTVRLRVGAAVTNIIAYLKTLPANFRIITTYLAENWRDLMTDIWNLTRIGFTNLLDNAERYGKALWDALQGKGFTFEFKRLDEGFKRVSKKLPEMVKPELISVEDEVGKIMEDITARETARIERLQKAAGPAPKKPGPVEPVKEPEYKLAGAVEITSKEAYSAIAKNAAGGAQSTTGAVKDMHGTLRQVNAGVRDVVAAVKGRPGPVLAVK